MACVWRFDGFNDPALDERFDERPPRLQGVLRVPVSIVEGSFEPESAQQQKDRQAREIVRHYFDQGIEAQDLQRMTAQDVVDGVPIGKIRERPESEIPEGSRGTVYVIPGPLRTVNNDCVPNEPPP